MGKYNCYLPPAEFIFRGGPTQSSLYREYRWVVHYSYEVHAGISLLHRVLHSRTYPNLGEHWFFFVCFYISTEFLKTWLSFGEKSVIEFSKMANWVLGFFPKKKPAVPPESSCVVMSKLIEAKQKYLCTVPTTVLHYYLPYPHKYYELFCSLDRGNSVTFTPFRLRAQSNFGSPSYTHSTTMLKSQ